MTSFARLLPALLCLAGPAMAADPYPSKPVTMVVPLAAGGTADIMGRLIGNEMSKALGQNVVIDNRPIAGGTVAMGQFVRAAPDGYTIALITQGTHVFNIGLYKKLDYDPLADFEPIAVMDSVSNVLVVNPKDPAATLGDILAGARAKPGEITFSSGGNGTSQHMSVVLLQLMTGASLTHVPYRGAAAAISAVMSGEVRMGMFNPPTVLGQIREGSLKGLAISSLQRSELLPDIPTLDASGVPGYEMVTWVGFAAPRGTPPEIIARWRTDLDRVAADPVVKAKLLATGLEPMPAMTPDGFRALIKADLDKWLPIIKSAGATAE